MDNKLIKIGMKGIMGSGQTYSKEDSGVYSGILPNLN